MYSDRSTSKLRSIISFILKTIKELNICSIYQSIEIFFSIFISQENNLNWYKENIKLEAGIWKLLLQFFAINIIQLATSKLIVASLLCSISCLTQIMQHNKHMCIVTYYFSNSMIDRLIDRSTSIGSKRSIDRQKSWSSHP